MIAAGTPARVDDDRDELTKDDLVLLIVEDDARFSRVLLDAAREHGFKCIIATRGAEVIDLVHEYAPNALTLDMQLPDEHGVEVLKRLKTTPATRSIPVIIMSVEGELPRHQRRGAVAQISKPITAESVTASLDKLSRLAGRNLRTLLIVEDDASQRASIGAVVRGDDVKVTSVGTGEEALKALEAADFDCAIVDLGLPDMDGFDLIEEMRTERGLTDLPIIVYTAQDLSPGEVDALHDLTEAVILKDISSFDQLVDETAVFLHRADLATDAPRSAPGRRSTGDSETSAPSQTTADSETATASEAARSVQRPTNDAGQHVAEAAMRDDEDAPEDASEDSLEERPGASPGKSPAAAKEAATDEAPSEEVGGADDEERGTAPKESGAAGEEAAGEEATDEDAEENGDLLETIAGGAGAQAETSPGEQAARRRKKVAAREPQRMGPHQPDNPTDDLTDKKVFIVDDDVQNIFALTSLLEGHSLKVDYAESGQESIDRLEQREEENDLVEAVLMDIMMPGMDGYETMRRLREREHFQDLPIIAVTAKALKGDREKCIAAGASDYITKPVDAEQLLSLLRAWIPA
jgi:CheY-like chemotaxis protein